MTIIFQAKTSEAYTLKTLVEYLSTSLKTLCFEFDEKSMKLCQFDQKGTILNVVELAADNFMTYKLNKKKLYVALNSSHFLKEFKEIKKKDSVEFVIDDTNDKEFVMCILPKENSRKSTSVIQIQNIQMIEVEKPDDYGASGILVMSSDFQRMVKNIKSIGSTTTTIQCNDVKCQFSGSQCDIRRKEILLGDINSIAPFTYTESFDSKHIESLLKMSSLSASLVLYTKQDMPLMIRTAIGTLGRLQVYIKSKKMIEESNNGSNA